MEHVAADPPRRPPGRPRGFDRERALEAAMLLFWRHGYEATSLAQLTAAMGVTPPSLYAAFGDKRRLFLAAVDRYVGGDATTAAIIDKAPTAREAARALLVGSAHAFTGEETPRGCLLATGAISVSPGAEGVQAALAAIRAGIGDHLRARIEAEVAAGLLPAGTDAAALSGLVMAVIQGLSTLARDGAPREALVAVAKAALQAWPTGGASGLEGPERLGPVGVPS